MIKIGIVGSRKYENKNKIKDFIFKLKRTLDDDVIFVCNDLIKVEHCNLKNVYKFFKCMMCFMRM